MPSDRPRDAGPSPAREKRLSSILGGSWLPILLGFCLALVVSWMIYWICSWFEPGAVNGRGLGAVISVNHALFEEDETGDLRVEFTLVNDSKEALEPGIADSRLIINGQEHPASDLLNDSPRETRHKFPEAGSKIARRSNTNVVEPSSSVGSTRPTDEAADPAGTKSPVTKLSPGEHVEFVSQLGNYCRKPGVYRVSWRGRNYASPEVVFRVLRRNAARGEN